MLHLTLVVCGVFSYAPWIGMGPASEAIVIYTDFAGARYSYGFFAPNIPNQAIAVVTALRSSGERSVQVYGAGTGELDHRISTLIAFFTVVNADNLNAASLAAYTLGHDPEAQLVEVSLRCYRIPSMARYRDGERPVAAEYYKGVYTRRRNLERRPEP